mgnify:CR=1 FL=1
MKYLIIFFFVFIANCSGNKVTNYHGTKLLEEKYNQIKVNISNKNDIVEIIGQPSTISDFDPNRWFYVERLKTNQSLFKLGNQVIKKNNILYYIQTRFNDEGVDSNGNLTAFSGANTITGQSNRPDPYGVVIKNYGLNRVYPRLVAEPYTYYVGNDQYFVAIYDFGLGENQVYDNELRLGESALVEFENQDYNFASTPDDLVIYKNKTNTENFTVVFENFSDNAIRSAPENSESIELKFNFPNGLTTIVGRKRVQRPTIIGLNIKIKDRNAIINSRPGIL